MKESVFLAFQALIYKESGIALSTEKRALLASRLYRRIKTLGFRDEEEYLKYLKTDTNGNELVRLMNAISTNVTYFFREDKHFSILKKNLEQMGSSLHENFKIWCAAASSGQEPYTIAITVVQALREYAYKVKILGTDISTDMLQQANKGIYTDKEVSSVPQELVSTFFYEIEDDEDPLWAVNNEIRQMVLFKKLNLVKLPYPLKGPLDIIFCRNVLIYFDTQTKQGIINEFWGLLRPGGLLFLSLSESLLGINHNFERFDSSVFKKNS